MGVLGHTLDASESRRTLDAAMGLLVLKADTGGESGVARHKQVTATQVGNLQAGNFYLARLGIAAPP